MNIKRYMSLMAFLSCPCIFANQGTDTTEGGRALKQEQDRPFVVGYEPKAEKKIVFTGHDLDHMTHPSKAPQEEIILKGSGSYDVDSALETEDSSSEESQKELTKRPTEFRSAPRNSNLGKIFPKFDPKSVSSKVDSIRWNSPTYQGSKESNFLNRNKATLGTEKNIDLKKVTSKTDSGLRVKSPTYKAENFVERNKIALGAEKNIDLKKVTSRIDSGLRVKSPTYKVSK